MRHLILAQRYEEARDYAESQGWLYNAWAFVRGVDGVFGLSAPLVTVLPTAHRHEHHSEIIRALKLRHAIFLDPKTPKAVAGG